MYGEEILNKHYLLRYGLTKEFYDTFQSLKYYDIEVPLILIRQFHIWIKPFVNAHLSNASYIHSLQKKYHLYTMEDVQKSLYGNTTMQKDLSNKASRKTILMPAIFTRLAIEQFSNDDVILIISNQNDQKALEGVQLPNNIQTYKIINDFAKVHLSSKLRKSFQQKLNHILQSNRAHKIFGNQEFKRWLHSHFFRAIKMIEALDHFIKENPIGILLDHVEVTIPGNILSLLAIKYNLPFLNIPQVLITDRSLIPTRATYYCVWGKNYQTWLNKRGIPFSKMKLTGNFRFEHMLRDYQSISKNEFIQQLGIPPHHLIITYTTQPFHKQVNLTVMDWIKQSIHNHPVTFIIKQHPYDTIDYSAFLQYPNILYFTNLTTLLANTDFLMTISSNTAIEAAMFNKGIIVLQPPLPYDYEHHNNSFNSLLVKADAGIVINSQTDLETFLNKGIKDKKLRNTLVSKGQRFLEDTVAPNISPSILIRKLVHDLIK